MPSQRWHPWRTLRTRYPEVRVITTVRLPKGLHGYREGATIWISSALNQRQRRCALTHELFHYERAAFPITHAEELIVRRLTACQLITIDELAAAFRWRHDSCEQMAEELWVTRDILADRLHFLDPIEVAELEDALGDDWTQGAL
ncbi:hypothetical protein W823_19095 [Williamsia sp. D3]|nr:hypothetical protein W823_19095 [Williamsia sp. D3]